MEKKRTPRGVLVGAFAGLLAFVIARIHESGRDAAQAPLAERLLRPSRPDATATSVELNPVPA
jgi:hypothetical protein